MCHTKEWTGDTYYETENHSSDFCFRKYNSVEESYRDHSLFLSQRSRYVKLFYFPITDYKSWARGLKEAGYSGNPHYADTLISIIEKYYLMHYDRKVAQKMGDTAALKDMQAPKPERIVETAPVAAATPIEVQPTKAPTVDENTPKRESTPEPVKVKEEPVKETPVKQETQTEVAKPEPAKVTENNKPSAKADATNVSEATVPAPEKINGKNVFVLNPYAVPFKQAYYPYTNRPVYENNKTKFIIAKEGDTYKKLAATMQLSEKNLRMYNDVYDDSEPVADEVIYLEMKSTKSPVEYHMLDAGDTYRYIAQRYAVQLKIIIKRNSGSLSSYSIGDNICLGCK